MKTLSELNKCSSDYLIKHWDNGGTSEFDTSINDISRAKIEAMKKEFGDCWLFKINRYSEDEGTPFMVRYEGQKIYNFEYCAIVPCYDKELEDLLIDYSKDSGFKSGTIMKKIEIIEDKLYSLKGVYLIWA
jgi:hypothetical protein